MCFETAGRLDSRRDWLARRNALALGRVGLGLMQCADKGAHPVSAGGNFPCPARSGHKNWNLGRCFETVFYGVLHLAAQFSSAVIIDFFGIANLPLFANIVHQAPPL